MIELKHHSCHFSSFYITPTALHRTTPHHSPLPPIQPSNPSVSLPLCETETETNRPPYPFTLRRKVFILWFLLSSLLLRRASYRFIMADKEDLGLSLSLSFPQNNHSLRLNFRPSLLPSSASSSPSGLNLPKPSWNEAFPPSLGRNSETCRAETRSFLRGIDVNRLPSSGDCEEEAGVSSPNSTISSLSGKRSERELANGEEHEIERDCSRGVSDEEDGETSRKKLRLSKDQSAILEDSFKEHNTLNPKQKLALAKQLGLRPRQVEVWFQNRRARTKLKQTEVDCEFLKRCCENLTVENRRLHKEVQELRALKLSPQFYMQMTPPTTLTMCPSCERVAVPVSSSATVDPRPHHHVAPTHARHLPINPWATTPGPIARRPFDSHLQRA